MADQNRRFNLMNIFVRQPRPHQSRRLKSRGQATLEFALTLPILLLLLLGIIEFGRLMFSYIAVVTSVREAARYGAASGQSGAGVPYYQDCDGIRAAAIRIGSIAGVNNTETSVNIQYDNGPGVDTVTVGCPVGGTGPFLKKGDRIVVEVRATFSPTSGLIYWLPSLQIRSLSRRTVLVNVAVR